MYCVKLYTSNNYYEYVLLLINLFSIMRNNVKVKILWYCILTCMLLRMYFPNGSRSDDLARRQVLSRGGNCKFSKYFIPRVKYLLR